MGRDSKPTLVDELAVPRRPSMAVTLPFVTAALDDELRELLGMVLAAYPQLTAAQVTTDALRRHLKDLLTAADIARMEAAASESEAA